MWKKEIENNKCATRPCEEMCRKQLTLAENAEAASEKILAKYLKYHFLVSKIVSELFKGIFA